MKIFFLKSVVMVSYLLCCFNPIALVAEQTINHQVNLGQSENTAKESRNYPRKEEKESSPNARQHRFRPSMYRKVVSGCLFFVGVATLISFAWFFVQAIVSLSPGCGLWGLVIIFPILVCMIGSQSLK